MPQMTLRHQIMKMFQRPVTKKRWLYGSGAVRKQTQAQTMVDTTMMIMNSKERRKGTMLRNAVSRGLFLVLYDVQRRRRGGLEQVVDHRGQVGEDHGAGRQAAGLLGLLALAGQDQVGHAAADVAGLQVAQRVAHRRHALQA